MKNETKKKQNQQFFRLYSPVIIGQPAVLLRTVRQFCSGAIFAFVVHASKNKEKYNYIMFSVNKILDNGIKKNVTECENGRENQNIIHICTRVV